jgi:glycosyltransferase involved in cell wall biosynthesis
MDDQGASHVLHIVGHVTDSVFSFLGPASEALAHAGYRQTIVMLDDPQHGHLLLKFPAEVRLMPVPLESLGHRHWITLAATVQALMTTQHFSAIHLHGFLPWLLGTQMGRVIPKDAAVYYSPHGSRTLGLLRPFQTALGWCLSLGSPKHRQGIIFSSKSDAQRLASNHNQSVVTIEAAIDDVFFSTPRSEARRPLLVSGDQHDSRRSVEMLCRVAVILSAAELDLSFNWIGDVGPATAARLKAANVGAFTITDDLKIASRLSAGWVFIAAGGEATEFPVLLACAMAIGLPCVVADFPYHRDLIQHGANGLIYKSEAEALAMVSSLIDDPELRLRLGAAAKADAQARFSKSKLDRALIAAYQHTPVAEPTALLTQTEN